MELLLILVASVIANAAVIRAIVLIYMRALRQQNARLKQKLEAERKHTASLQYKTKTLESSKARYKRVLLWLKIRHERNKSYRQQMVEKHMAAKEMPAPNPWSVEWVEAFADTYANKIRNGKDGE